MSKPTADFRNNRVTFRGKPLTAGIAQGKVACEGNNATVFICFLLIETSFRINENSFPNKTPL